MKTNKSNYRFFAVIILITAFLLLIPLLAMQFTDEVTWSLFDFAVAGALLSGTGFTYKLVTRKAGNIAYRAAAGVALATGLFMVWSNLAVGIIGSEDNSANWMYIGVLAVGIIGTVIARLQPQKMSYALFATALANLLVTVIALTAQLGYPDSGPREILIINGFFIALWVGSALLFWNSNRKQAAA